MEIIEGDLLDIDKGIIIHQVNNCKAMGSGVAGQIRAKYNQHYIDYKNSELKLGGIVKTKINNKFGVVGIIAQNGYGRDKNKVYTDYIAFEICLNKIRYIYDKNPKINFYMPYGIGAGLANGDWNRIYKLIKTICPFIKLIRYNK